MRCLLARGRSGLASKETREREGMRAPKSEGRKAAWVESRVSVSVLRTLLASVMNQVGIRRPRTRCVGEWGRQVDHQISRTPFAVIPSQAALTGLIARGAPYAWLHLVPSHDNGVSYLQHVQRYPDSNLPLQPAGPHASLVATNRKRSLPARIPHRPMCPQARR